LSLPLIRRLLPAPGVISGAPELEEAYLQPAGRHVRVNFVATLDGVIEVDGRSGPLGGAADRAAFMAMRAACDVTLVGAGTVRVENYGPVKLEDGARTRRQERGQSELPRLAIVSAQANLEPGARVFSGSQHPILVTSEWGESRHPELKEVAEVVICGADLVDLGVALDELDRLGLRRVCCEGGPMLLRSLLAADLLDELCLTFSPLVAGSLHRHLTGEGPLPSIAEFHLDSLLEGDGMLMTRYAKADPR
jgi:riboflavin biosynthesis pyrimidine reductase